MPRRAVRISLKDNVATALDDLVSGDTVSVADRDVTVFTLSLLEPVPFGHKMAVAAIGQGEDVIKYGVPIGAATQSIGKGAYVHTHNVASKRARVRSGEGE